MRMGKPADDRVIVSVKQVSRDEKTGKVKYETTKSIDIFDATPLQVEKIVFDALAAKSEKK